MTRIVFDEDARAEFLDAVGYYASCEKELGNRFKDAVAEGAMAILEMPFRFRSLRGKFRRCLVSGFPYGIIYTIEPDFILIVAVAHAKRKPGYWKKR